ncbi:Alkylglycerol monooxygenase, partial [Orchesella cincta]
MEIAKGFGRLFYIISPNETAVEKVEDIPHPDYINKAIPYFITLILLEYVVQVHTNTRKTRLNDGIVSLAHGLYLGCQEFLFRGIEHYVYIKIYEKYRLVELPWDSPYTWYLAAIGVDLGYYWVHRACHEVNIFWAQHQVHHSSEDYNLTTALRQAGFQGWIAWIFYLPLAFFVPSPIFLIHQQFNLLFQFWIHTEVIESLGPLEWILNTPKHHRIHHGSNRYCLDKNYAGVLIIWDRMFGTFAEEKPGEEIKYGLVEDIFYVPKIWNRMKEYNNWGDKLSVLLKGPGWSPGKPRLGDLNEVPLYPTRETYDVKVSTWKSVYVVVHFLVLLLCINFLAESNDQLSQMTVLAVIIYVISSLTSTSFILEDKPRGVYTEALRCLFTTCLISTFIWLVELLKLQFIGYKKYRTE